MNQRRLQLVRQFVRFLRVCWTVVWFGGGYRQHLQRCFDERNCASCEGRVESFDSDLFSHVFCANKPDRQQRNSFSPQSSTEKLVKAIAMSFGPEDNERQKRLDRRFTVSGLICNFTHRDSVPVIKCNAQNLWETFIGERHELFFKQILRPYIDFLNRVRQSSSLCSKLWILLSFSTFNPILKRRLRAQKWPWKSPVLFRRWCGTQISKR